MENQNFKRTLTYRRVILFISIFLLTIFACTITDNLGEEQAPDQNIPLDTRETEINVPESDNQDVSETARISISLSDGQAHPQEYVPVTAVDGEPLSDEEIAAILERLPNLEVSEGDQEAFHLPGEAFPPPRTGEIIDEPFPSPSEETSTEIIPEGPLEVLRYAPEGEVPIAPFVNVTFNQPMVPVTTIEDLETSDVPVLLEPKIPGTWHWIGTKTIVFESDSTKIDRLPMATEYKVTISAGTTSMTGGKLAEKVQFSFSTPPPTLQTYYPNYSPQPVNPIFFAAFDQLIDPDAVIETIKVTANGKSIPITPATEAELEKDKTVSRLIENAGEGRWISFKTSETLPKDTDINVSIGPGTPSAEGPIGTKVAQNFSFHTYAHLRVVDHGCYWAGEECRPFAPFFIEFNNPIDTSTYDDTLLKIDPELPGASVNIFGNTLQIRGSSKGQTTYRVTISGKISDTFGQTLGEDETLKFKVGPAEPVLVGPDDVLVTLDPASKSPTLSLYTINYTKLDLLIYQVEPSDWPAFKEYLREYQRTDKKLTPPGKLVLDETRRIEGATDSLTEVGIDLSDFMEGDFGQFVVIVTPPRGLFQEDRYWEAVQVWVQITQIGIDAFVDHSEMVAWVNELSNGKPINDVVLKSDSGKVLGTSDSDGLARFAIPPEGIAYLVASRGMDNAFLPPSTYYWGNEGWSTRTMNDELRWYVIDDRQMYRPGEEVHIKGWIRKIGNKQDGDVGLVGGSLPGINYQVFDPQGNDLGGDRIDVNAFGGFDFQFTLPENINLGFARIEMSSEGSIGSLDGQWYTHGFQVQEFRRPEFEVQARNETTGPYFNGDTATVAVEAKYYAGGPLPNAEVNWLVSSTPTNYSPPNWPDFTFGIWQPWWYFGGEIGESQTETFSGKTDATGNHYLDLAFARAQGMRPFSILAEATVMDVNRQAWSARTTLIVHPAEFYVGLRSDQYFVERGNPLEIDLIVTDLEGVALPDRQIQVKAARMEWKYKDGNWSETEADIQECTVGSKEEPVQCIFDTPLGGRYQITATVTDNLGRQNRSQFTRWVSGGEQLPKREVEKEEVTLIPNKENYQPGDTARILVQSPFSPAEGLLTISRSGILYTERFVLEDSTTTLKIPIESKHIPNLNVQVDLLGSAPRVDNQGNPLKDVPERPAYASGYLTLNVPPLSRTLSLEVIPEKTKLEPGGKTTLQLSVKDENGKPVPNAEIAVIVVDEAVLALTNYTLIDPISIFYSPRPSDVNSYYSRASIILVDPQALVDAAQAAENVVEATLTVAKEAEGDMMMVMEAPAAEEAAPRGMGGGGQAEVPAIQVRTDFNPLAAFVPEVGTDSKGQARVEITLPDNLTRYRVMAVVVDNTGSKFGTGEANITARLPLMVRPSAPRFLNFGDTFEMPVVVQNQTDEEMTVDVVIQVSNLSLTNGQGVQVLVPANDRVEIRFPTKTDMAGTARFQAAAVSGTYSDAADGQLPVYTPATTEAFATYGVLDEGSIIQPIGSPSDVFQQFGGLEIQTSSTALQALTDAVIYLVSYPYECSEQLASRILGIAALRDVLSAFKSEGLPSPEALETTVINDIDRLKGLQNWDGGFPYWRRGQDSIPFNSIHVAHALQRAKLKGYEVPEDIRQNVLGYLQNIESHYPAWYSKQTRQTLSAYALYVRDLMGDSDPQKAKNLLEEAGLENLSLDAVGWIWQIFSDDASAKGEVDAIRRFVNNRVVETAGAANFTTSYDDQNYLLLGSNRRTDAILLDALIVDDPQSDLIPKVVNGLLSHRVKGRWNNTQENVFVLLALDRYFNTFEAQTPDFVARIWLGDTYAGEHAYSGRTTERHETEIPMAYLVDPEMGGGQTQDLLIIKEGTGRLYYRLGLRYAPTDLWLDPLDMGFVVQRVYEAVDDPEDVTRDEDGVWHIKAGARVRVRLTMVADNRRYHVALVDPLPAGLEIVNPALAVSGSVPEDPTSENNRFYWWWFPWYNHQNMRDERAEAFTYLLWDGVYEYTYIARATTPGTFIVPPAKAEEMYSPEVFGRSASDWVVVE